jgi:hypothetical protein
MRSKEILMKRLLTLVTLLTLTAILLSAADLSGKWKGAFDFNGTSVPLTFDLKADGEKLTGTVTGLPSDVAEIKDGKIQDDNVTFWLTTEYQGSPVKLVYKGKLSGDELRLTMGTDDGNFSVDLVAKRST